VVGVHAPAITIEPRHYAEPDVQQLVAEVQQEYVERYGGPDAAVVDPVEFDPPNGLFLVALLDGSPVASGGWRRLDDQRAEIKRMFVVRRARRRGIARLLLAELERTAAEARVRSLVLNTGSEQPEAVALYEAAGYRTVPGFGYYADAPRALFYGKDVSDG
jgi:GNAT superfamily N-acetyltransferase